MRNIKTLKHRGNLGLLCLCLLLLVSSAAAQVDQGAVTGVVTDDTGAVVPKATVTLTDVDTGLVFTGRTNESGLYTFAPVKIGNYTVNVSAPGFQQVTHQSLHVDAQQRLNVPVTLNPGVVSQSVTVTGAAALLETQSSAVKQVVSTETINNTPLNGRNWVYIAQLTAGVAASVREHPWQRLRRFRGKWPARGAKQFHSRRRGQQHESRRLSQRLQLCHASPAGCFVRVQPADQQLQRRVRTLGWRS